MAARKPKVAELYYIEWKDACANPGWIDITDIKDAKLASCKSVGWIIGETPEQVTLVSSQNDGGGGPAFQVDGHITIPTATITRRIKLKVGK